MKKRYTIAGSLLLTLASFLHAGPGEPSRRTADDRAGTPPASPPAVAAGRAETSPVVDGDVLGDPAWESVEPATGFWQVEPIEGAPATEDTEVRVLFDDEYLYIGVVCFDNSPDEVFASDSRRDASLDETDSFQVILDTFLDRQNGFVFGTNPAGVEYDGQVTREGQGGGRGGGRRQQGGSGGGFNLNWDADWTVRTEVSEIGWSIEFQIPFRTLRYGDESEQSWGVNFKRIIRRHNETAYWSPLPRQFNLHRLSQAGTLTGVGVPKQRNLKFIPYVLGQMRDVQTDPEGVWTGEFGADAKWNPTGGLTLDMTYNTDFAQVEVDEQQINLDRFNLFFPEKRPFFLENAGFFSVGNSGQTELFFSRRIGISDRGAIIPIYGGGRLSGKIGSFTNVGLLMMQTESLQTADETVPSNNFAVARVSRELPNRSSIGGIFVNRQATGSLAGDDDYNRTFGLDGRWGIGEYGSLDGFVARTSTPGLEGDDYAFRINSEYNSPGWEVSGNYGEVADNFNPEVGFLRRSGFRNMRAGTLFRIRHIWGFQELRPHTNYEGFWNFDGFQETGRWHIDNHWEFKGAHEIHTGTNLTREGVGEPFTIWEDPADPDNKVVVPPGTYDHAELAIVSFTNRGAPLSVGLRATVGGFFGGDRVELTPSARFRVGDRFNGEVNWTHNDIDLPGGSFKTDLARFRVAYSFTPRIALQTLVQYNTRAGTWSSNVRFSWLQAANTGLFVVYNDTRGTDGVGCANRSFDPECLPTDRALIVKFSRMFDLLD